MKTCALDPVKKFRAWLERQIALAQNPLKLASDVTLAKTWGVGRNAITSVLQEAALAGRVTRCRGRGTVINARHNLPECHPVPLQASRRFAELLRRAI